MVKKSNKNERGNALWFILIAIVLMGLLAVTLSRSGSSVEQSGDYERASIIASQALRAAKGFEQAIIQMQGRGVSESDLSFQDSGLTGYTNPDCATGTDCQLFSVNGGGLTYGQVNGQDWVFTGANNVDSVETDTALTDAKSKELLAVLPVSQAVCARINGMNGLSATPPQDANKLSLVPYTGDFASGADGAAIDPAGSVLARKLTGCVQGNQDEGGADISGNYYFYHVLIAR